MENVLQFLKANWVVIAQAPYAFGFCIVLTASAVWAALSYLKSDQIASLEARLKLRDDKITELERVQNAGTVPAGESPDEKRQIRRLTMIQDGRRLVADFNAQSSVSTLIQFLGMRPEWHAIRAQLDPKVRGDMENPRLAVGTRGDVKDGKIYYLVGELDRLEIEWGLV